MSNPTERVRFPRPVAIEVCRALVPALKPWCANFIIAGSLRRGKRQVGDIEILYIPKLASEPDGFFDTKQVNLLDRAVEDLLARKVLAKRQNVNGSEIWGQKNKFTVHLATGIPVDLFATKPEAWFNYLVCRTGGQRNNVMIAEAAKKNGLQWNPYGEGFTDLATGEVLPATSEEDVYRIAGLPYSPPFLRQ